MWVKEIHTMSGMNQKLRQGRPVAYFILIGLRDQLKKIPEPSISLNLYSASTHTFTPNSPVRNLNVIFDQSLGFSNHITHLSRSCFMHISATFEESVLCSISKLHLPS